MKTPPLFTMTKHSRGRPLRRIALATVFALGMSCAIPAWSQVTTASTGDLSPDTNWVTTWTSAPIEPGTGPGGPNDIAVFENQTIREIAHISVGGRRVRVSLSNAYGSTPLAISAARIALHGYDDAI